MKLKHIPSNQVCKGYIVLEDGVYKVYRQKGEVIVKQNTYSNLKELKDEWMVE